MKLIYLLHSRLFVVFNKLSIFSVQIGLQKMIKMKTLLIKPFKNSTLPKVFSIFFLIYSDVIGSRWSSLIGTWSLKIRSVKVKSQNWENFYSRAVVRFKIFYPWNTFTPCLYKGWVIVCHQYGGAFVYYTIIYYYNIKYMFCIFNILLFIKELEVLT